MNSNPSIPITGMHSIRVEKQGVMKTIGAILAGIAPGGSGYRIRLSFMCLKVLDELGLPRTIANPRRHDLTCEQVIAATRSIPETSARQVLSQ